MPDVFLKVVGRDRACKCPLQLLLNFGAKEALLGLFNLGLLMASNHEDSLVEIVCQREVLPAFDRWRQDSFTNLPAFAIDHAQFGCLRVVPSGEFVQVLVDLDRMAAFEVELLVYDLLTCPIDLIVTEHGLAEPLSERISEEVLPRCQDVRLV